MRVTLSKIGRVASRVARASLAMLLLFVAASTRSQAQTQEPETAPQEEGAHPRRGRPGGNSLMQRLNLTPEQRARLREIRRQGEPEERELARRVRLARRNLDEAIYADAADEALVGQRVRALSEAQAALLRLRASTELSVRRVLTHEQLQAFRELRRQAQQRQQMRRRRHMP